MAWPPAAGWPSMRPGRYDHVPDDGRSCSALVCDILMAFDPVTATALTHDVAKLMLIALHNLATRHCDLRSSIQIAKETGYAGIEIGRDKLDQYLGQGSTLEQ